MLKKNLYILALLLLALTAAACAHQENVRTRAVVTFADACWDSVKFNNAVAAFIAQNAYGLEAKTVSGSASVVQAALVRGDADVNMELWTDNVPTYAEDMRTGKLVNLGVNFDDNKQGVYVPRYLIEGDAERGIKPLAPNLKTVRDLARYAHLFADPEAPGKGRFYGAVPGWSVDATMYRKYEAYGLDKNFRYFRSGSEAALNGAFLAAYAKGEPIAGYNYEPTWISGKIDLVLLDDAPYTTEENFQRGLSAARSVPVCIVANKQLLDKAPEFAEFLQNYRTSSALIAQALAHMADTKCSYDEAARWFLAQHPELIRQWLPASKQEPVIQALQGSQAYAQSWLWSFPRQLHIDCTQPIDGFFKHINATYANFFDKVKNGLTLCIISIERALEAIPWWAAILGVAALARRLTGKYSSAALYAAGLTLIGCFGYWQMMTETLAVVIASVALSLIVGLPIGVMVSASEISNKLLRPLLDAMQTMPTFVYMIPAVMLLGPGKTPAVLATVIYAVVPVIRLTSHGIRQVDKEVVEASSAFGASRWQTLLKVQIPQALPTIMAGVNQTMMMAVAMVVTCAMIGANGLGMEVLIAINRTESGRGLVAGLSIVVLAIIIDRLTQSLASARQEEK